MIQTILTASLGLAAMTFLILWVVERFGSWEREDIAVSRATRELRIALRFIACEQPTPAYQFAEYVLRADHRGIERHFPRFTRFRAEEIRAEAEGEYAE